MSLASDTVKRFIRLYSDGTPETYGSDAFLEVFSPTSIGLLPLQMAPPPALEETVRFLEKI